MLRRAGSEGFSPGELDVADEFARLATLHAARAIEAYQLRRSAETDALTGTLNRHSIDQWLGRLFADPLQRDRELSLLFIDVDLFKDINDRLGHSVGDECLRQIAHALGAVLGVNDVLGRYGGEEFIAILPGCGLTTARSMGERLRTAVESCNIVHDGDRVRVTVSIGVATRHRSERDPAATLERADKALYAAKRGGRNCVHAAPAVFA